MELDTYIGIFILTGTVHIGTEAFTKLICNNNDFLQSITIVPLDNFQHKTLDIPFSCDTTTKSIDATTLAVVYSCKTLCCHLATGSIFRSLDAGEKEASNCQRIPSRLLLNTLIRFNPNP